MWGEGMVQATEEQETELRHGKTGGENAVRTESFNASFKFQHYHQRPGAVQGLRLHWGQEDTAMGPFG